MELMNVKTVNVLHLLLPTNIWFGDEGNIEVVSDEVMDELMMGVERTHDVALKDLQSVSSHSRCAR